MRNSWRFLLSRTYSRSSLQTHHFKVIQCSSVHSLSSLPHIRDSSNTQNFTNLRNPFACYSFSSESLVEEGKTTQEKEHFSVVSDIFTKFSDVNDIANELELNNVVISHEIVLDVLKSLWSNPDGARSFFDWVLEKDSERLSSKACNLMLGILGVNGLVDEFWCLVESMKKKGYGVSKYTRDAVSEKFERDGLKRDLERLKGVYATGSVDNSMEKTGLIVSRIVRNQIWGDGVEEKIKGLNVGFSSGLVKIVVENLAMEPVKALVFFRWVEESGMCKHDEGSYNAIATVLGREDCADRFWKVVEEMRANGYEMEVETYSKVLGRFINRKMIKDAVDLYEFSMTGANKPSMSCCIFLLRKIAVGKELEMHLLSRVVEIFTGNGNMLTESMVESVLKSLRSVGRFGECTRVLKIMEERGFVASSTLQGKIAFGLTSSGKKDEASEFVDQVEASGSNLDYKAWACLIEGYCVSGDLEKAKECFQTMVGKEGVSRSGYAFESLVNAYSRNNRAIDACKILHDYVTEHQLKPWHTTYKALIAKLLVQDGFEDALNLLNLMKSHGFPPYVDPFVKYISKSGSGDDAVALMKAMTTKKFPSTSVVLRLIEAFFKAGRHGEAQDFVSKCPGYIRSHADVLNLFISVKSGKSIGAATVAI